MEGRLDEEIKNMKKGILMLEGEKSIEVIKKKEKEMMRIEEKKKMKGRKMEVMLRYWVKKGMFKNNDIKNIRLRMEDIIMGRKERDILKI